MTGIPADRQLIFTAADANYMPGALVSLYNALLRSGAKTFAVVTSAPHSKWLTQGVFQLFEDRGARLHVVETALLPLDEMKGATNRFPVEAFARFFAHCLPCDNAMRALYIDSDVMALGDLDPLLQIDLEGRCMGVAPDIHASAKGKQRHHQERIGLPLQHIYMCSGVILIDIERYRRSSLQKQIASILADRAGRLSYPNQEALNIADRTQIKLINPLYNFPPGLWRFIDADERKHVAIAHFYDGSKPWGERAHRVPADLLLRYDALAGTLGLSTVIGSTRPWPIEFHSQIYTQKFWLENIARRNEARRAIKEWLVD